jgi:hypothetical protein
MDRPTTHDILGALKNYTLMELYFAATKELPRGRHARALYGALCDPPMGSVDGRPSAPNIVDLFDTQQVNGWLRMTMSDPVQVTCAVILVRPACSINTPQPSGKDFLNPVDFKDDIDMSNPAEESERNIWPNNERKLVMPKKRPALKTCLPCSVSV